MAYHLRNLIPDASSRPNSPLSPPCFIRAKLSHADLSDDATELARLIHRSCPLPSKGHILHLPTNESKDAETDRPSLPIRLESLLSIISAPSPFGLHVIARNIVLKYGSYLQPETPSIDNVFPEDDTREKDKEKEEGKEGDSQSSSMASTSVECMLSVLLQLARRDTELCAQALTALLSSLQILKMKAGETPLLRNTQQVLLELYHEGRGDISSLAGSCLIALSIASFDPDILFSTAAAFLCGPTVESAAVAGPSTASSSTLRSILIPENLHRLSLFVQQKAFSAAGAASDWWSSSMADHVILSSFDLSSTPSDSSPETPDDDRRLYSAIASDGAYIYVLNYIGLYKIGTGFSETIGGKIYASNTLLRSSRNCTLSFCNGSLYLRRGQSSRVWVLDEDSLRERGEIILPSTPPHSTIFCDATAFYQAHLDANSTLVVTRLNDSFQPVSDSKVKQKLRLTKLSYDIFGDAQPVPHSLIHSMPSTLHGQVSDLHVSRDIALLLARTGKVYYAGNANRLGLQDTGSTWMELVLPETIVQISVGSETILFRSGSGHVWIAGYEEKKKSGKLRRLHTVGRKKVISIAASSGCFMYVTENGKVYAMGKHPWRVNPDNGLVLGLEGVHIAAIALGKVHAVAVSRSGTLYTWGVNNLGQCGRKESPSLSSSPRHASSLRAASCSPSEHLWIHDVASMCVQCGKCSSRGAACDKFLQLRPGGLCPCGPGETACLRCGICRACVEASISSGSVRGDLPASSLEGLPVTHKISLAPSSLQLTTNSPDIKVASVSCGNFHTIVLTANRQVYTFGSNAHGQLGVGDALKRAGPQKISLPAGVQPVQVAAGANHCVVRAADGSVFTFGAHKSGQLGRRDDDVAEPSEDWHCSPGRVPRLGPGTGTCAGWIGASGDTTFIHAHSTLLEEGAIGDAQIVANKNAIFIFPRQIGKNYIVVKRKQNAFAEHQLGPAGLYTSYWLDSTYNVMWTYSAAEMRIVALGEASAQDGRRRGEEQESLQGFLRFARTPELMVPVEPDCSLSNIALAVNLLSSTYALTLISVLPPHLSKDLSTMSRSAVSASLTDNRSVLNRFEGNGGGWGYSAHSVDAIQMFRLQGLDGDELYVEEVATTDEVLFECPPNDIAPILFTKSILIRANIWHVISAKISGPSSDCGSSGHARVEADGVVFNFRNSTLSNNGTDVTVGQIPEMYFQNLAKPAEEAEERTVEEKAFDLKMYTDFHNISRSALLRPAPSVYCSLLRILRWATTIVFGQMTQSEESLWQQERATLIAVLVLKTLRFYTETLYPSEARADECIEMAEPAISMFDAIHSIFEAANNFEGAEMDRPRLSLVEECIASIVASSHLLLASPFIVASQLATYMGTPSQTSSANVLASDGEDDEEVATDASSSYSLERISQVLIREIAKELVKGDFAHSGTPSLMNTPCRFRRRTVGACWDMASGAPDAIALRVDRTGVIVAGIGVYCSGAEYTATYTIEMFKADLSDTNSEEKWELVEKVTHLVSANEGRDTANLKFNRAVPLDPTMTYLIKIASLDGGKTFAGEHGASSVRLCNGARISYGNADSSRSQNGTCLARGQIPHLMYSIKEDAQRGSKNNDEERLSRSFCQLLRLMTAKVGEAVTAGTLTTSARDLVSAIAGFAMVFMEAQPKRALEVVAIVDQLLPMVSSVNGVAKQDSSDSNYFSTHRDVHFDIVESTHPYLPSTVQSAVIGFDKEVELMFIDMDECSRTVSADDVLWIYVGVDTMCYVPVARFSGSSLWRNRQLMLPGNSAWFILESAAMVEGASESDMYGFRCSVHGYSVLGENTNLRLEQELAWLSASACRLLVQLPSEGEELTRLSIAEEETKDLLEKHGSLLRKGLNMSHIPTLHELHTRSVPPPGLSPELKFIREFISGASSMAGALARWLPMGAVIDPAHCQLLLPQEEFVVDQPAQLKLITRDQHGRLAQCNAVAVEVTVHRGLEDSRCAHKIEQWCGEGTLPPITLFHQNPYLPVYMNKARYMSIGMMPAYANYSYEELRLGFAANGVQKDTVGMTQKSSTTHCGTWFPRLPGVFRIECRVDGFQVPHSFTVEVVDRGEKGARKNSTRLAQLSKARLATIPPTVPFPAIRIRTAPSLIASEMGLVPRGSTVSYIEELENAEGRWLRLTEESVLVHTKTDSPSQAWVIQFHRALDRTRRAEEILEEQERRRPSEQSVLIEANEMYILAEGDRVELYATPSLAGLCKDEHLEGRREILTDGWIHNSHGVWIRIAALQKYILAEDAVGHSSVHSQLASFNGNDEEEEQTRPRLRPRSAEAEALRPSIVDCIRTVFGAFLWHEHLVKDAMAAATYLKFHANLSNHLIMPSPPAVRCAAGEQSAHNSPQQKPSTSSAECELCDEPVRAPVTVHMRSAHPGCGGPSQALYTFIIMPMKRGHGYNSSAKYTTGWSGACGGRSKAMWYLLCPACRQKYLRQTSAGHHQERKRRWREFRLSSAALSSRPETVMKQNALFLLELNASADGGDSKNSSTNTSGWTINLFPTNTLTPSPFDRSLIGEGTVVSQHLTKLASSQAVMRRDSDASIRIGAVHASDPGPKGRPDEKMAQGEGEVLQSPSTALKSLVSLTCSTASAPSAMLRRPVLAFVLEHHDLKRVREAATTAVYRAVAFAHAFRYVWSLSSYAPLFGSTTSRSPVRLLPHPWRLCFLAGPLSTWMVQQMHSFLYTVAVILQSTTLDTRLRSLCFKAWTIQLSAHEQDLLILTCNILATVGGVLSEPSSDCLTSALRQESVDEDLGVDVKAMSDASSRQAMVVCLTDGSPDTFWESGDEDKARYRSILIRCEGTAAVLLCLYIDNVRDEQYRVSNLSAKALNVDGTRHNVHDQHIDQQFAGWVKICVAGPGASVRVRQLLIFGLLPSPMTTPDPGPPNYLVFSAPQRDAFALFQAISSQAFSDELSEDQHTSLRQRVLDLLFSRVHLQPLQTYVCSQMVNALEREVTLLRDRNKRSYSYACGLMAMLVRVIGSRKGTEVFAARDHLLITLSELLLFAPQVVQCQVIETIERLFSVFQPSQVDTSLFVSNLLVTIAKVISLQVKDRATRTVSGVCFMTSCSHSAPAHWRMDRSISPEVGRLVLQLIDDVTSDRYSSDWSSCIKRELAVTLASIVHLSTDFTASTSATSMMSGGGGNEPIFAALRARRFWLSVAALAVLKDKQWLELAESWRNLQQTRSDEPEMICENHDDGRTRAQVHCDVCSLSLCRDCFRILHLHKRNRSHEAHLIGAGASSAPHVDIHAGCSRLRLANLLILLHSTALTGMVELTAEDALFPSSSSTSIGRMTSATCLVINQKSRCRFCSIHLPPERQLMGVCAEEECIGFQEIACEQTKTCGHQCGGVKGEAACLPCMKCPSNENRQDGDDVCVICLIDRIGAQPSLMLECGHVFHYGCLKTVLERRWNGPRILFRFMNCPLCNCEIAHPSLSSLTEPLLALKKDVETKARMRLEYDGLMTCAAIIKPESEFHNRPLEYAMDRYVYVLCFKCGKAYFGGESRCQLAANDASQYNPTELICGGCCDVQGVQMCGRHGVEFLEYKCRFCCSIAVYFCFGTTHFCTSCHDDFQRLMTLPKQLLPQCPVGPKCTQLEEGPCPLRVDHAPTGEEFALGCGVCRNLSTF
ncbi:rpm-1 [Pristionchus pacificus]|uniref:RCR-type E3 ubiquitin transferase n=1 Tax=Pristionchus pacificus TaxID=54126 RepID=A0A2A6C095_PRIPA|nr:rpm-1 [Pristionchus pacificus]|eukprot:PDM71507.1 rpm-1 [Pristionchus pacificus]